MPVYPGAFQQPPDRPDQGRGPQAQGQGHDRRRSGSRTGVPVVGRLVLLQGRRPSRRAVGARESTRCPRGQGRDRRRRDPPQGHPARTPRRQARQGRPRRRLPAQQAALPRLPHRARQWLADRDRRDRRRLPTLGQGPDGHHRRPLGPARRRSNPETTRPAQQQRLRPILGLPPRPRTTPQPRPTLRQQRDPTRGMTSLQRSRTKKVPTAYSDTPTPSGSHTSRRARVATTASNTSTADSPTSTLISQSLKKGPGSGNATNGNASMPNTATPASSTTISTRCARHARRDQTHIWTINRLVRRIT